MSGPAEAVTALIEELFEMGEICSLEEADDFVELVSNEVYDGQDLLDLEGGEHS